MSVTARTHLRPRLGFTLIELLVVISIIALLIGILLPVLGSARSEARAIACGSNARQVMIATETYVAENKEFYPPAYVYASPGDQWDGGGSAAVRWDWAYQDDANSNPTGGYVHWTYLLFSNGSVEESSFTCPEMENGGLPATNPRDDAFHPDQTDGAGAGIDRQARWNAYAPSEVLIPRNKFNSGANQQRLVRASEVALPSATISITEFVDNYRAIADGAGVSKAHRGIQPFMHPTAAPADATGFVPNATLEGNGGTLANYGAFVGPINNRFTPYEDLLNATTTAIDGAPINAVGRHHPGGDGELGGEGTANFAFADGHTVRKTVRDTVLDGDWGDRYYSLSQTITVRDNP
ncbi:MAG: prepilin-type N-terminal cleavage/methylation domain-containing protein [Planctomycetota bacterium]